MPAPIKPTFLRRLPADFRPPKVEFDAVFVAQSVVGLGDDAFYQRHEGGLLSRALGTAVHMLLEDLAKLRKSTNWEQARSDLKKFQPRVAAQIRAAGVDSAKAAAIAAEAFRLALDASNDLTGNWILSPHPEDSSEVRWTGVVAGGLRTVQVDRLFRAGLTPLTPPETKPGGSSTTRQRTPMASIQPQRCPECVISSRLNLKLTQKFSPISMAKTHLFALRSTIRACCSSIGGKYDSNGMITWNSCCLERR